LPPLLTRLPVPPHHHHRAHKTTTHTHARAQLELLIHLLDVTGPYLDRIINILNTMRRILPIDASTYQGKTTVFTKAPGTIGMGAGSVVLARKPGPGAPANNGAPPAPTFPPVPVPVYPKTLPPRQWLRDDRRRRRSMLAASSA
jgi:hypothetical protein